MPFCIYSLRSDAANNTVYAIKQNTLFFLSVSNIQYYYDDVHGLVVVVLGSLRQLLP